MNEARKAAVSFVHSRVRLKDLAQMNVTKHSYIVLFSLLCLGFFFTQVVIKCIPEGTHHVGARISDVFPNFAMDWNVFFEDASHFG